MVIIPKCTAKKLLKQRLDLPIKNKFKAMVIIPKMHGQKTVETTVRFCI